jgi:hypothetical protein
MRPQAASRSASSSRSIERRSNAACSRRRTALLRDPKLAGDLAQREQLLAREAVVELDHTRCVSGSSATGRLQRGTGEIERQLLGGPRRLAGQKVAQRDVALGCGGRARLEAVPRVKRPCASARLPLQLSGVDWFNRCGGRAAASLPRSAALRRSGRPAPPAGLALGGLALLGRALSPERLLDLVQILRHAAADATQVLAASRSVVSTSLSSSREPRLISERTSFSAAWAGSMHLAAARATPCSRFQPSSARCVHSYRHLYAPLSPA